MDRFTKVRNIGKGNMGACYLMRSLEDGKLYVIKQIDLSRMNKKERSQSLNEAKVLSSLRHPNVINYVDSFLARKSESLCIAMEYADSGDLGSAVKASAGLPFAEDQILDWFIQLVVSVIYTHSKHILHRDIKLQNVFVTSTGLCKLGDFGIARVMQNTFDQAHTFVGTPYYLSPEVILEKPYGAQSDVWAVGVCLYELMSHRHPFNATDMKSLMQRILRCHYDPLPAHYSRELREIVQRVLVKDASRRLTLPEILQLPIIQRRLQAWVAGTSGLPSQYVQLLLRYKQLPLCATVAASPSPTEMVSAYVLPKIGKDRKDPEDTVPQRVTEEPAPAKYIPPVKSSLPQVRPGIAVSPTDNDTETQASSRLPPVVRPAPSLAPSSQNMYEVYGIPQPHKHPVGHHNISPYGMPQQSSKNAGHHRGAFPAMQGVRQQPSVYHLPAIHHQPSAYHHQPSGLPAVSRLPHQQQVLLYVPPRNHPR